MSAFRRAGGPPRDPQAQVYDAAYTGVPNWDIGRPQRAFVELTERGLVRSPVLEVGCGTGELALFLARQGHDVLGIDFAPRAIGQARAKARWRRIAAHFLVWNALDLPALVDRLGVRFRTVVDSAMYHVFGETERERFIDGLATALAPGGAYFLFGDARPEDDPYAGGISEAELRARFGNREGWRVAFVEETVFERRYSWNPAYIAGIVRT